MTVTTFEIDTLSMIGLVDCVSSPDQTALDRALELAREMSSGGRLIYMSSGHIK